MNPPNDNPGIMTPMTALLMILLSVAMLVTESLGYSHLGYWFAMIPALLVFGSAFVYRVINAAVYTALQDDFKAHEYREYQDTRAAMNDAVTLDADKFLRSVTEDDDGIGRA